MKTKIILISFILVLVSSMRVKAQELANYNLYMQNSYLYNPAYTIDKPHLSAFLNSHIQWMGFDDAPSVNTFGIHGPMMENSGVGLTVVNYTSGLISNFNANISYAYRVKFAKNHFLHLGTSVGFMNDKLAGANSFTDLSDDVLTSNSFDGTSFAASAGLAYIFNGLEAQLIFPQLYHRKTLNLYTIGIVAYNYDINTDWSVKPSVQARGLRTSPLQYDVNIMGTWQKMVWLQLGYRTNNSLITGLGVNFRGFDIGYAYQMNNNELASISNGTHEFQLIYNFGDNLFKRKKKTHLTGTVKNLANNQPIVADLIISEGEIEVRKTQSVDSSGIFEVNLRPEKTYNIKANAENYYPENIVVAIAKDEKEKTVDILLAPHNAVAKGFVRRKDNNKAVEAKITVFENNIEVATTSTNPTTGAYKLELRSGRAYRYTIEAKNYISIDESINIEVKTIEFSKDFILEALSEVHGLVTDSKDNSKIKGNVNIYKGSQLVESLAIDGSYEKILHKDGKYIFECKATDYIGKKITINLKGAPDNVRRDIKLLKLEKGAAFQLGNIGFKTGTAELTEESFATLDKLYNMMYDNPELNVEIAGHTDSDGSAAFNKKMSGERATSCVNYLVSKGLDASRIKSVGYGESKPLVPNSSPANKAKNRRVEFKFID